MDKTVVLDSISPEKDVDGLHPLNVGLLVQGRAQLVACTPSGVVEALRRSNVSLAGTNAVVVGRSDLVGKPLALLLMHENATVTVCHSKTKNLQQVVSGADVVIAAMGRPAFLTEDFIREGAVVIDVGTTVLKEKAEIVRIFGEEEQKTRRFSSRKSCACRGRSSRCVRTQFDVYSCTRRRWAVNHHDAFEEYSSGSGIAGNSPRSHGEHRVKG